MTEINANKENILPNSILKIPVNCKEIEKR